MPARANPGAESPGLRERLGADPLVWTYRMLAALESGVKGFFAEMGLFSLERAYRDACQSR